MLANIFSTRYGMATIKNSLLGEKTMALKQTVGEMHELLARIGEDLAKAEGGNKAASQRVRVATIELEKIAKRYRKESITTEKRQAGSPKSAKKAAAKKPAAKKMAKKPAAKKAAVKKAAAKKPAPKKKVTAKVPSAKKMVRTKSAPSSRRATAKSPRRTAKR